MGELRVSVEGAADGTARPAKNRSSADSLQALPVIIALNLVRVNIGMYPSGNARITQSLDRAFEMVQTLLRGKSELLIGFTGDTLTFGETAPDREKGNAAFRDYARSLNNLRIVNFTLHRGLTKEDLREFSRILSVNPAEIWGMGKIESVFVRSGIKGITVKVIDADHFRLKDKKIVENMVEQKSMDADFWQGFFSRLKSEALKKGQSDGTAADPERLDPLEAIRFLNRQREHWPSAVVGYEKLVAEHFSEVPAGRPIDAEQVEALIGVNAIVSDLHPELKKQMIEVVERQMMLHPDGALAEEHLKCFPRDIFIEIIRKTNERQAQISPALVNLLKKMADVQETTAAAIPGKDADFSTQALETLLKRESYEHYVPEAYDALLRRAAATASSDSHIDESQFPLQEHLKTLAEEHVDFRIALLIHSLMDGEIAEDDYLACSRKIAQSLPELLRAGNFSFLSNLMETLRRHSREKPSEPVRQKALSVLGALSDKKAIATHVTPVIRNGVDDPAPLTAFLLSSGVEHLSWLYELYLDPKVPLSGTLISVLKGFGKNATAEALKRLPNGDPQTVIRLLTLIREMGDKSVVAHLNDLIQHEEWAVRREVIRTLNAFDDPQVCELLRRSLRSVHRDEVFEAVGLACKYRIAELLDDLTSMLKTRVIREDDAMLNEWIVAELTKTGHPAVLPQLERIAAAWATFSPEALSRMKIVLYRNLGHFPKQTVLKLLRRGSRSRTREIRMICGKILKSKE